MKEHKTEELKKEYNEIPIPKDLMDKLEKNMQKGVKDSRKKVRFLVRGIGTAAAAMLALVILLNTNATVAKAMENVPVLGQIVKVVSFRTFSDEQKTEGMEANIKVPEVSVTDGNGSESKNAADELNCQVKEYTDRIIAQYQADAAAAEGMEGHEAVDTDYEIATDNERLFALRINTVIAMGGSDSFTKIYNMDKTSGRLITLKELFAEDSDYIEVISGEIKAQMRAKMQEDDAYDYFLGESKYGENCFDKIKEDSNFYVNKEKELTIVFDKYEAAPGFMGVVEFSIPTEKIADIVKAGYVE